MTWSTWKRLVRSKMWENMFSSYGNAWLLLTSLRFCDWSGHFIGARISPRSLAKRTGCVTLFHWSWRSTWFQACGIRVAIACVIRGRRNHVWYAWITSYISGTGWSDDEMSLQKSIVCRRSLTFSVLCFFLTRKLKKKLKPVRTNKCRSQIFFSSVHKFFFTPKRVVWWWHGLRKQSSAIPKLV